EELVQRDDWFLFRQFAPGAKDTEAYVKILSEPGALTPALNWYRANLPVQALLGRIGGPQLPMIKANTLGIWSSGDLYLTEEAMTRSEQRVEGTWRCERCEGPHWGPLDHPARLNDLLLDFLQCPSPSPAGGAGSGWGKRMRPAVTVYNSPVLPSEPSSRCPIQPLRAGPSSL